MNYKMRKKIKPQIRLSLLIELMTLLNAGIPIITALICMRNQQDGLIRKTTLIALIKTLQQGYTIYEAMQATTIFSTTTLALIKVGETTGTLERSLKLATEQLAKQIEFYKKIKAALIYPCLTLSLAIIIIVLLLLCVIPQFESLFSQSGIPLPLLTRLMICLAHITPYLLSIFSLLILALILIFKYHKSFSKHAHSIFIAYKPFANIARGLFVTQLCRTLVSCYNAGIPIHDALMLCHQNNFPNILKKQLLIIQDALLAGHAIHAALQKSTLFSLIALQMVAIGEEAGKLSEMLLKIAEINEAEVDQKMTQFSLLLEPILMIIIGIIIGGLIVAIYLPLFQLGSTLT